MPQSFDFQNVGEGPVWRRLSAERFDATAASQLGVL
jgi:hypothetical protein